MVKGRKRFQELLAPLVQRLSWNGGYGVGSFSGPRKGNPMKADFRHLGPTSQIVFAGRDELLKVLCGASSLGQRGQLGHCGPLYCGTFWST